MKNIAILYICTGNYYIYWKDFYESCEKYLFPNDNKTYYVFTDYLTLEYKDSPNVKVIYQSRLGFFYDTLMRFHMFLENENELSKHDYIYFLNSNAIIKDKIEFNELDPDKGMLAVIHPGYLNSPPIHFDYERNPISKAFISIGEGIKYYMGGFYGGASGEFLKLCKFCRDNINEDFTKEYIAKWHDESHSNRYFVNNPPKFVSSEIYAWPEEYKTDKKPKVILRDKKIHGYHDKLRGMDDPAKIVIVMGGLANQMFQYAFYLKLKKYHKNVKLSISNRKHGHRKFELSNVFNFNFKDVFLFEQFQDKLNMKVLREDGQTYGYKPNYILDPESAIYYGFWQTEKYFLDIKDEIMETFKFPKINDPINLVFSEEMKSTNSVSIHIRRGDYLNYSLHNFLTDVYYNNAISHIKQHVKDPVFFIFSDDIEFCKKCFKGDDFYFIDHNKGDKAFRDMQLMSLCKHNIICNSTFSWWGAWLNQNPDKIVISPNKFYNDPAYKFSDIYLDSWIKLPC